MDLVGLLKLFGGGVRAVDAIDLNIQHGELVSLLGPSGCGKTTTLRLVAGFLQPDGGEIRLEGQVISSSRSVVPPERRNMSMIFQSYAIWPHKTVSQNVAYGLKFRSVTRHETDKKVRKMLQVVQLEPMADRYPGELSGGQQQRVALARALVVEPQILLLDEPLSNLDAKLREEMRFEIRRLHDEFQITSIYVTHDQSEAMVIADRICVMNQGRPEQIGTPDEIYERPRSRFVAEFIGKTNLLSGTLEEEKKIKVGDGLLLNIRGEGNYQRGKEILVCIRPHNIRLTQERSEVERYTKMNFNHFSGTVIQRSYFGDAMDYLVQLGVNNLVLRVIRPPSQKFEVGQEVVALTDPDHCVVIQEG